MVLVKIHVAAVFVLKFLSYLKIILEQNWFDQTFAISSDIICPFLHNCIPVNVAIIIIEMLLGLSVIACIATSKSNLSHCLFFGFFPFQVLSLSWESQLLSLIWNLMLIGGVTLYVRVRQFSLRGLVKRELPIALQISKSIGIIWEIRPTAVFIDLCSYHSLLLKTICMSPFSCGLSLSQCLKLGLVAAKKLLVFCFG